MAYTIGTDAALEMIEVVYTGPLSSAERAAAIREGSQLLSRLQYRRVLVDLRDATLMPEPTHRLADLGHVMAHAPAVHSSRLAYVVTPEQEANRIVENMAAARHMDVARFLHRDIAIAWLQAPPPAAAPD